jgi:hypothetical protein
MANVAYSYGEFNQTKLEKKMADIQGHKDAVAKYVSNIDSAVLDKMAKNYALVLSNKDSQFVSCGDQSEKDTVRENFLKKKLGLTDSDEVLNASIESVCVTMKEDRFKSRLAFYYLLAAHYGKLTMFA